MGLYCNAGASLLILQFTAGEFAVVLHGIDGEEHFTCGDVGVALGDQCADHVDHALDMFRGAGFVGWHEAAKRFCVGLELVCGFLGDFADGVVEGQIRIVAECPCVDLVVDVSEVADVGDVVLAVEMAQQAE